MNMSGSTYLDAMHWLCRELTEEFSRTRDFALIHDFLTSLNGFERKQLLGNIFWGALKARDWDLAEKCLAEGYPMAPTEEADSGPLHCAMSLLSNRPDVIQWLIQHGAVIDRRGFAGVTPLMIAAHHGWQEIVDLLLQFGADADTSTIVDDDSTALMAAAAAGNEPIVRLLLAHGVRSSRRNAWGRDAAQLAESKGHDDLARLIRDQSNVGGRR